MLTAMQSVRNLLPCDVGPLNYLYTLEGEEIKSFKDINEDCKILIVSSSPNFQGLGGIEQFGGE